MAESLRAKTNRYVRGDFTAAEYRIMLGSLLADQVIDIATFGALSKLKGKAFTKVVAPLLRRLGPPVIKAAGGGLGAAAYGVGRVATRGALPLGMAMTAYDAYEMGKRDAELGFPAALQQLPTPQLASPKFGEDIGLPKLDVLTPALRVRKKVSTYARNVGKAMKAIKASNKAGKKGKLTNPKKTFSIVSKTVSKIMKGGKRPRGGITGIIAKAVKGKFKQIVKLQKKASKKGRGKGFYR